MTSQLAPEFDYQPSQAPIAAPLVSIVMPAFNCARFVSKAIDSVLAQSMAQFELIVVDDASTDTTWEAVAQYQDPRIRLMRNARNMGPSHSRNAAILQARGEWIALLDADDWYAPDRLEQLLARANEHQADAVADDLFIIDQDRPYARSTLFLESGFNVPVASMLRSTQLAMHEIGSLKPMFRRSLFTERGHTYDPSVCYGEDYLLYLSWLLDGVRVLILPEPLYFLRRGATGSLTTRRIAMTADAIMLNQRLLGDERVRQDRHLARALAGRIVRTRDLLTFYRVICPLRERHYRSAASALISSPGFLVVACRRLPAILGLRLKRLAYRLRLYGSRTRALFAYHRS